MQLPSLLQSFFSWLVAVISETYFVVVPAENNAEEGEMPSSCQYLAEYKYG